MTREEFAGRLLNACAEVKSAEAELTEIDSRFGDADHGLTMHKICTAIENAVGSGAGDVKAMLTEAADAVMGLNGGSAVPLWNSWLDGMAEGAPETDALDIDAIKAVFAAGFEELDDMSGAARWTFRQWATFLPRRPGSSFSRRCRRRTRDTACCC